MKHTERIVTAHPRSIHVSVHVKCMFHFLNEGSHVYLVEGMREVRRYSVSGASSSPARPCRPSVPPISVATSLSSL